MDNTQNIISFCTGYGGIEIGIKRTGLDVRTVAYVEIEAFAVANLVAKIEQGKMDAAPIWTDLKTFDGRPFRNKVHGIIGGYPCQPFSNAGQRKGTEDPRHLFPYICEHIRAIRPLWCFFENVGGHLNLGFDEVYKSLRDLGYQVEAGLFTAAEVGAPHKRERLFILAYSSEFGAGNICGEVDGRNRSAMLRQGDGQIGTGGITAASGDGELGNSQGQRCTETGQSGKRPTERTTLASTVANPNLQPDGQNAGRDGEADSLQGIDRQKVCRGGIAGAGQQLADTKSSRRQGSQWSEGADKERWQEPDGQITECGQVWPARPGQPQYEWEEPRTVESGMGRTANGFKSRVDELRLLGNGVVPQTAELAFKTLWTKI